MATEANDDVNGGAFADVTDEAGVLLHDVVPSGSANSEVFPQVQVKKEDNDDLAKLKVTLPLETYAYATGTPQLLRIDPTAHVATTQLTPLTAITDQGLVYWNVQDLDASKIATAVVEQGAPVLVLNNIEKGTYEANVMFDQCNVQPTTVQPAFQTLQALAHANLLQQTQEQIAKELGVSMPDMPEEKVPEKLFICDTLGCGRTFTTLGYLKYHKAVHDGQKTLTCNFEGCNRKFAWPAHLKYHELTHTGERLHECCFEGCGKRFYTAQRLQVHSRIHTGEKPFICPESGCGRSFSTAGNLKNHCRIHTGERPFVCQVKDCGKSFAEYSSLRKHKLVHSGEKPFSCHICGKTFSQSGSRNVHMKKHKLKEAAKALEEDKLVAAFALPSQQQPTIQYTCIKFEDPNDFVSRKNNEKEQYEDLQAKARIVLSDHVVTVSAQPSDDQLELPQTMLGAEEILPPDDCIQTESVLIQGSGNVVVLSQPNNISRIPGFSNQVCHQEEIVYDSDLLQTELDHEEITDSMNGNHSGSQEALCEEGMHPMMEMDDE